MWCQITLKQILSLNSLEIFFFFSSSSYESSVTTGCHYFMNSNSSINCTAWTSTTVESCCAAVVAANECHPAWCTPSLLTQQGKCVVFTHIQPVRNHKMQRKCTFSTTFSIIKKKKQEIIYILDQILPAFKVFKPSWRSHRKGASAANKLYYLKMLVILLSFSARALVILSCSPHA